MGTFGIWKNCQETTKTEEDDDGDDMQFDGKW
jgi:hypothetical protein